MKFGLKRASLLRALAVILAWLGLAASASMAAADDLYGIGGVIGDHPVAMMIEVHDHTQVVKAQYSYASQGVPIPLGAAIAGDQLTLTEPGGGVFHLRFVTSDTSAPHPLNFYRSTGLKGDWVKAGRTLPVDLHFMRVGARPDDLPDCALYPVKPPAKGQPAAFPMPGCTHTPDKATLDHCLGQKLSSGENAFSCIAAAEKPCRQDQADANLCSLNVASYLDARVKRQVATLKTKRLDLGTYKRWTATRTKTCEQSSDFGPDGSGYGADINDCMSAELLRLLQGGLDPDLPPARSSPPKH